jgi:hypothetical protein
LILELILARVRETERANHLSAPTPLRLSSLSPAFSCIPFEALDCSLLAIVDRDEIAHRSLESSSTDPYLPSVSMPVIDRSIEFDYSIIVSLKL